jgi:GR25 family glycosyltransferase involved in LPS biosynthesis
MRLNAFGFTVFVALVVLLALWWHAPRARIASASVINLEKSKERLAQFKKAAAVAGLDVERWPAFDGRTLEKNDIYKHNISELIWHHLRSTRKLGVIGCWASHQKLLASLENRHASSGDIHLIFEDDAVVPTDFKAQLERIMRQLPTDWDVIQLNVILPRTIPWSKQRGSNDIHVPNGGMYGNDGCAAYAVRHGALRKINAHLKYMNDPIDTQLKKKNTEWKWFIMQPVLVPTQDGGKSTLPDN